MTGYDNHARPAGLSAQGTLTRVGETIRTTNLHIIIRLLVAILLAMEII
jgi:hypothetical protein